MYDRDVRPDAAPDPVRSCLGYLGPATVTPVARARRIVRQSCLRRQILYRGDSNVGLIIDVYKSSLGLLAETDY